MFIQMFFVLCAMHGVAMAKTIPDTWYPNLNQGEMPSSKRAPSCEKKCKMAPMDPTKDEVEGENNDASVASDSDDDSEDTKHSDDGDDDRSVNSDTKNDDEKQPRPCFMNPRPKPQKTITEITSIAHKKCQTWMKYECESHICPTYCHGKYPASQNDHHHKFGNVTIDPQLNECLLACEKTKCTMPIDLNHFDGALKHQMTSQMTQCIDETRGQGESCLPIDPKTQKWRTYRHESFEKMENAVEKIKDTRTQNDDIEKALKES